MDQNHPSPISSLFRIVFYLALMLSVSIVYLNYNLPESLKNVEAELFDSHYPKDLSKSAFPAETLKSATYLHNKLIKKCEDL